MLSFKLTKRRALWINIFQSIVVLVGDVIDHLVCELSSPSRVIIFI